MEDCNEDEKMGRDESVPDVRHGPSTLDLHLRERPFSRGTSSRGATDPWLCQRNFVSTGMESSIGRERRVRFWDSQKPDF